MTNLNDVCRAMDELRIEMLRKRRLDIIKELFALEEITKEEYVKLLKQGFEES